MSDNGKVLLEPYPPLTYTGGHIIDPQTSGNTWVHTQHCSYWCPGANAPGHQYLQRWLNIHCIGQVSYNNITFTVNNTSK